MRTLQTPGEGGRKRSRLRRVNIYDVAKRAGVSKSTVSRVLSGGYVSPAARGKVLLAMGLLQYAPSGPARHLSLGRSGCVGFLVPSIEDSFQARLVEGASQELAPRSVTLFLGTLGERTEYHPEIAQYWIRNRQVDGLVITSPGKRERPLVRMAEKHRVPMVFVGKNIDYPGHLVVRSDNREAGRKIGRHLVELGHRNVAYVGVSRFHGDSEDRLAGLREGLAEGGGTVLDKNVFRGDWRPEDGEAYAQRWLALSRRQAPTAVVAASDLMALGFLKAVLVRGVAVPGEVALVGFDDLVPAGVAWPGLTTIRQPGHRLGAVAVRKLLEWIKQGPSKEETILLPVELVVRESTVGNRHP